MLEKNVVRGGSLEKNVVRGGLLEKNDVRGGLLERMLLKGLGPELSTFLLKMTWKILPSKERLAKIQPKTYKSPTCLLPHSNRSP